MSAYTVYAHYLALLILQATPDLGPKRIPTEANEFREAILSESGTVTFENVLRFSWELGIPVLPLNDAGAFHGAFWRVNGRNVIVLEQDGRCRTRVGQMTASTRCFMPDRSRTSRNERSLKKAEMSTERRDSAEEQEATMFAGDVMLDGRARGRARTNVC